MIYWTYNKLSTLTRQQNKFIKKKNGIKVMRRKWEFFLCVSETMIQLLNNYHFLFYTSSIFCILKNVHKSDIMLAFCVSASLFSACTLCCSQLPVERAFLLLLFHFRYDVACNRHGWRQKDFREINESEKGRITTLNCSNCLTMWQHNLLCMVIFSQEKKMLFSLVISH